MSGSTKISVLISVYKHDCPFHLQETLSSLLNQSYPADEVVVIKDGLLSCDLEKTLSSYSDKLNITQIPLKMNMGLGFALNTGILNCKNNLVARIDSDDICYDTRFERQINIFNSNPKLDILGSFATEIDNFGKTLKVRKVPILHDDIKRLVWACPFIHPSVMFKRDSILKIGSYNKAYRYRQDYDLWFRACSNGLNFSNIPEPLIKYRIARKNYKSSNFKTGLSMTCIGIRGCFNNHLGPVSYLGVILPLIKSLTPSFVFPLIQKSCDIFDPRIRI